MREREANDEEALESMQLKLSSNRNAWLWPIFLLLLSAAPPKLAASDSPLHLPLKDESGAITSLNAIRKNETPMVLIFVASTCPVTTLYWERIKGIWYNHREHGVTMYLVGGNSDDSLAQIREQLKDRDLDLPLVWDEGHGLAKAYGIQFTPEALVLGKDGEISYRGLIDDSWRDSSQIQKRYLEDAISGALEGKKVPDQIHQLFLGSRLR